MSVPLKIVIESEQSPQFQAAIDQIEGRVSRLNTSENRTRMQALAIMRGQTVAANAIATAQARVAKEVAQVTQQMTRQAGFMASLRSAFGGGIIARGGALGTVAGAGFTGAAFGSVIGAGLAMGATAFLSALKSMTVGVIQTADALSDVAEQLGVSAVDVVRLREAAQRAGIPQRFALRSLSYVGQARSAAIGGDEEMRALFANYGVSQQLLEGDASNMEIARRIRQSLGAGGMQPRDARNLQRLFGQQPERAVAMLGQLGTLRDADKLENSIQQLDRTARAFEAAQLEMERRQLMAQTVFTNPLRWLWERAKADSALAYYFRARGAFNRNETAPSPEDGQEQLGERTAGDFQVGAKKSSQKPERSWIWRSFDLESGGMSRLGLYGTRGQEMLARSALNIQRSMLDTLRAIDRTLSASPMLKETLTP